MNSILNKEENKWIQDDRYVIEILKELFLLLDIDDLNKLQQAGIIFAKSNGEYSSVIHATSGHIILIYPELFTYIRNGIWGHALAILMHEVAHIVLKHHQSNKDWMNKQIEADAFCCQKGLGLMLEEFLSELSQNDEISVRKTYIAAFNLSR